MLPASANIERGVRGYAVIDEEGLWMVRFVANQRLGNLGHRIPTVKRVFRRVGNDGVRWARRHDHLWRTRIWRTHIGRTRI